MWTIRGFSHLPPLSLSSLLSPLRRPPPHWPHSLFGSPSPRAMAIVWNSLATGHGGRLELPRCGLWPLLRASPPRTWLPELSSSNGRGPELLLPHRQLLLPPAKTTKTVIVAVPYKASRISTFLSPSPCLLHIVCAHATLLVVRPSIAYCMMMSKKNYNVGWSRRLACS